METTRFGRQPLKIQNMNVQKINTDSDSSDSDSPPKIRKTRSTRTVRRTATNVTTDTAEAEKPSMFKKQVSVYSTRVTKCLDDFKSGRLQLCIEKDNEDVLEKSPPQTVPTAKLPKSVIDLDDTPDNLDSSCITSPESSFVRSRSPTPPPTPGVQSPPKRQVRSTKRNRNVQQALRTLEDMKGQYEKTAGNDEDDDDDLVLVSHICSPVVEKKDTSVMVRYKDKVFKYTLGMDDSFHNVKTQLSSEIAVKEDCLFFMLGERNIHPWDSPKSIGLHIADIIDCHVYTVAEDGEVEIPPRDAISLYVQCQNRRNKLPFKVHKHQPLRTLMKSYARKVKTELSYLKFMFDGEDIMPTDTPDSFDMEDNDTIDAVEV